MQSGAADCERGIEKCFLKVALTCLGTMAAAIQPNSLWNYQKTFDKTFFTTCLPRLYMYLLDLDNLDQIAALETTP